MAESVRVDAWLWAVRILKSRSAASTACRAGHVQINGERAKPASPVRVGDSVRVRGGHAERVLEVRRLIVKRVGAPVAVECYVDHSPPPPPREIRIQVAIRDPGTGRPTKRERRQLDRLRGHP
ncbi:RNA-binding S4 domain protein [Beutenbergia cavernae DSM 12333]|uniref:RNA-binding S4 domain protein n=1 Tax=Beutenbergia cavernae (strain ATCC BAA-8 / DSM 12333 / CCUG 43141 / JCM 11478 / NBRC 16432 / NCIMB 13614 / HKI 0122) TaxID=471853 RepID=C5C3U9_BEUC1|nr:RNA-binding S4 domain-containing protein [Beutenbergia cavernae]ACQ82008.1 RNA-binding S4 domain protein [Beutenbergia cavernae DSM 12333]